MNKHDYVRIKINYEQKVMYDRIPKYCDFDGHTAIIEYLEEYGRAHLYFETKDGVELTKKYHPFFFLCDLEFLGENEKLVNKMIKQREDEAYKKKYQWENVKNVAILSICITSYGVLHALNRKI